MFGEIAGDPSCASVGQSLCGNPNKMLTLITRDHAKKSSGLMVRNFSRFNLVDRDIFEFREVVEPSIGNLG